MALYRISNSSNLLTVLSRTTYTANISIGEVQCTQHAVVHQNRTEGLHLTSIRRYPDPPTLPLPTNVSEIFANETSRFTPERARDIAAPILLYGRNDCRSYFSERLTKPMELSSSLQNCYDTHVDSYDCFGAISLNGIMQSNVPKPFSSNGKSMHLNMPGGEWARDEKYIAEDMQKSHYRSIRLPPLKLGRSGLTSYIATNTVFQKMYIPKHACNMEYSTKVSPPPLNNLLNSEDKKSKIDAPPNLSMKEKFKVVVKEYGITVTMFHIGISLISLGACYTAVASGLDLNPVLETFFKTNNKQVESVLNNSSTFLFAYGIHKLMAPIRISITLVVAPFLVRALRKAGFLKRPKITNIGDKK